MDLNQQILHLLSSQESTNKSAIIQQVIGKLHLLAPYPIILIGGTNGKGSTCAYLTTILTLNGYKVGSFTSPHMFSYNERICINNQPMADEDLNRVLHTIISTNPENLDLFSTFTLAAHLHFMQQNIDIAVIEVGIGGLRDVTNEFEPTISAITTISLDHCHLLGNTLEQIATEKAGIFRANKPAFIGMQNPPQSLVKYAAKINARLQIAGIDFGYIRNELCFDVWSKNGKYFSLPHPALRGMEQLDNASLAIAILAELKTSFPLAISTIKTGILQSKLPGRFTILPGYPQIVLDVAHNQQSVLSLLRNMLKLPFVQNSYAVFGIAEDKDIVTIITLAAKYFSKWFIAPINSKRSISNITLGQIMQKCKIDKAQINAFATIKAALSAARNTSTNDDRIVCFGSFLVVEEAYNAIK